MARQGYGICRRAVRFPSTFDEVMLNMFKDRDNTNPLGCGGVMTFSERNVARRLLRNIKQLRPIQWLMASWPRRPF